MLGAFSDYDGRLFSNNSTDLPALRDRSVFMLGVDGKHVRFNTSGKGLAHDLSPFHCVVLTSPKRTPSDIWGFWRTGRADLALPPDFDCVESYP